MRITWAILATAGVIAACSAAEHGAPSSNEELTGTAASPLTVGGYLFRGLGGKCMTVSGSGAQGDRIVLSTCTGAPAQRFQVVKIGDAYELRAFGRCVDVTGASFANGTPLQLYTCNSSTAQRFDIRGDLLRPKASTGYAVEVKGGFTTDGTPIQLYSRNMTLSQAWKAVPIGVAANTVAGVSLASASVPTCTAQQVRDWDSASVEREGALVSDPKNAIIGTPYAKRTDGYYPLTGRKETMCGNFNRFGFSENDGVFDVTGDNDWNVHMVPTHPTFVNLKNSVGGTDRDELEAEIFVDKRYWTSSPWFDTGNVRSSLAPPYAAGQGHPICAYGPYVNDKNHEGESFDKCRAPCGKKIEIHPSEFLWWRDVLPTYQESITRRVSTEYMTFLHLQDNSGDFDDTSNFASTSAAPSGWEPWSNSPLRGLVRIPWRYTPGGPKTEMRIVDDFVANVVTSSNATASADQTGAGEQTLAIDGTIVLRVSETTDVDANLGVKLNDTGSICRRPNTSELLGFVSIRDDIGGDDDEDTEGTHVFSVAKSTISSSLIVLPPGSLQIP